MFRADEIVVEPVGFFARQCQHLLGTWRKIVHRVFVCHILLCFYLLGLSNAVPPGPAGFEIGRLTFLKCSRNMSERSKSRSSAESFSENCFCRCAGWVRMNNSSVNERSPPGNKPKSMPKR